MLLLLVLLTRGPSLESSHLDESKAAAAEAEAEAAAAAEAEAAAAAEAAARTNAKQTGVSAQVRRPQQMPFMIKAAAASQQSAHGWQQL